MSPLLIILALVALAVVVVLVLAMGKGNTFEVKRSAQLAVKPEQVFPIVNDFHKWSGWSPWDKLDPELKREYSGAPEGKGAVYTWSGNKKVGKGRMEITDSVASSHVVLDLHFITPFEARNVTRFEFQPVNGGTLVTWSMRGERNFAIKVMSVFMDMDNLVGKDFDSGLANMKSQLEKGV